MRSPEDYFDLQSSHVLPVLFEDVEYVWQVLSRLPALLARLLEGKRIIKGDVSRDAYLAADCPLYIGEGARIEPGAYVSSAAYIGPGAVVRHGAYIRENCILLERSLLGHSSEAKSALFLPEAKAPHFAYVGDSVLGSRVNLGAGSVLSNVPLTRPSTIQIATADGTIDTGLRKFGAILGDEVQVGCNAVLNPGTLVGPRTIVYPNLNLAKGFHPADAVLKLRQTVIADRRHS